MMGLSLTLIARLGLGLGTLLIIIIIIIYLFFCYGRVSNSLSLTNPSGPREKSGKHIYSFKVVALANSLLDS